MTAKEYLSQIRTLDTIIRQKRNEVAELHEIATSIGSFDYSRDRVQTSPKGEAPYARVAEKAAELDDEIRRLEDELGNMMHKLDDVCRGVLNDDEYALIRLRYYDGLAWSDIMSQVSVKERTMYNIHSGALIKLEAQDVAV